MAHLLTDFIFQPDSLAQNKGNIRFLLIHCLIFFLLSNLCLFPLLSYISVGTLGLLAVFHGLLDYLKNLLQKRKGEDSWLYFLGDQALHLLGITAAFLVLDKTVYPGVLEAIGHYWSTPSLFMVTAFFIFIIFGGSYFIGLICKGFLDQVKKREKPGIEKAGRYLGMIERSLVLTAVLIGRVEFIGYIFAAKSIARYPEMKEETRFVEYYLIGTLTSISMAFFGGLLLKHLLGW